MGKLECIKNYAQKQMPVDLATLSFIPIKTVEQFILGYKKHDVACSYIAKQYLQHGYILYSLGVDLREKRVFIKNEMPDYIAESERGEIFCFDSKAKSSTQYFGWVNERAVLSYRQLARECNVEIYLNFAQVMGGRIIKVGHARVENNPIKKIRAWNGNTVWVLEWEERLAKL
jgi:hypothetical protein